MERVEQRTAAGGGLGGGLLHERGSQPRGIDGGRDGGLVDRQPGVGNRGEVQAAVIKGRHTPMADDRMQGLLDFQPNGHDRIGDLLGVRAVAHPVGQRRWPWTTLLAIQWHGALAA